MKTLITVFFIMTIVILIICGMELFPTLNDADKFLMSVMFTIAITGCFCIAVGINLENEG